MNHVTLHQGAAVRGDPCGSDLRAGGPLRLRRSSLQLELDGLGRAAVPSARHPHPQTDPHASRLPAGLRQLHRSGEGAGSPIPSCCPCPTFPNGRLSAAVLLQVQVVDSVVYSNYSVGLEVVPSPPVASIRGGTNVFTSRDTVVSLDGQKSYDPDFPTNPVR